MNFTIKKGDILAVLSKIQGLTNRKSNLAITENVLLTTTEQAITLMATDLETGIEGSYPASVDDNGSIAINARKFFEIVREFPSEDIIVNEIKFDPRNSNVLYIGTEAWKAQHEGLFMSIDKGDTWFPVNTNGIEEFPIYAIAFDGSGDIAYIGTGFGSVWRGTRSSKLLTHYISP